MKKIILIINLLLCFQLIGQSQKAETLVTIDGKNISAEEFIYLYEKNNSKPLPRNSDSLKTQLNKFINYKLKVFEAEKRGFDKSEKFIYAFTNYKKQLAEPFLLNTETFEKLALEAYQRTKYEIRVSHILVKVNEFAAPVDTLIAYNKAMNLKIRLVNTESFENVAKEASDDPSAAQNGGDLWFVKAFQTPYKLENHIFNNTKNVISSPIRTKYGYHIIKITDRRPNPGKYKVAHIVIYTPKNISEQESKRLKKRIDSLYQRLLKGDNFAKLAIKYSEDKGTANNKGELPWFGTGFMSHEFENAAFGLKQNGAISKPVQTENGWHIIKRIDQQKVLEYKQMKDQIKKMILKSDRFKICEQNMINRFKKENNFSENKELGIFYTAVDSTIFEKKWIIPTLIDLNDVLFKIGSKEYTKYDFAESLEKNQKMMFPIPIENYVNQQYEKFRDTKIIEFGINILSRENKSYKNLVNEFHDGMLFFEIMETEVWEKAKNDTLGIKNFYKQNIKKYNKNLSANISIFKFENGTDLKKLKKYFQKYKKLAVSDSLLAVTVSKSVKRKFEFKNSLIAEEGSNPVFDLVINEYRNGKPQQKIIILEKQKTLVFLNTPIAKTKKPWQSYKAQLITDYQHYTDKKWTANLRSKYTISINKKVLNSIQQ